MGVTTPEKPFDVVLKGFLTEPQGSALDDQISSHSICFPHPSFSPLFVLVLANEELLVYGKDKEHTSLWGPLTHLLL